MGPQENTPHTPYMNETPTCSKCLSNFAFTMALLYFSRNTKVYTNIYSISLLYI